MKKLFAVLSVLLMAGALWAAPVAINSTAVSGQSVTVNTAAAHGLAVNQAVCLAAPSAACGVVTAVNTTTQFVTLVSGTVAACASSCGTETPAPQVIVLTTTPPSQGFVTYTWLNWLTNTQPCPGPAASSWTNANGSAGASAAQTAAIKAGLFVEHQRSLTVASATSTATVETLMQNDYAADQAAASQPCQFYGFTWDPTTNAWVRQ